MHAGRVYINTYMSCKLLHLASLAHINCDVQRSGFSHLQDQEYYKIFSQIFEKYSKIVSFFANNARILLFRHKSII